MRAHLRLRLRGLFFRSTPVAPGLPALPRGRSEWRLLRGGAAHAGLAALE
jgi:hypothetical protein